MFALANLFFILIAAGNVFGIALKKTPSVGEIVRQLAQTDNGVERLRSALILAGLAQVYLIFLVFPLKAANYYLGLAWSCLMLIALLETVHTARMMLATVAAGDREARFPWHDSVLYPAYQVFFNLATIGVCVYLLLPR